MNVFCAQSDEGSFTQSRFTSMTSLAAAATCCAKRQRANQTQQNIFQFCGVAAKLKIHNCFFIKKLASKKNRFTEKKFRPTSRLPRPVKKRILNFAPKFCDQKL